MQNLRLENLDQLSGWKGDATGAVSDKRVTQEMKTNGMETAGGDLKEGFANMLQSSMEKVNDYQIQADSAVKELVAGRTKNMHETMLSMERADVSMKLMMQVRNKVLDAYREIMRMQV